MDEIIKERQKKLQNPKREDLVTVCHERLLNLRKRNINKYINDKRMLSTNSAIKYEILLDDINLSEEMKQSILNQYNHYGLTDNIIKGLKSDDNSILLLSLFIIRRYYTQCLDSYSQSCNNEEVADNLTRLLLCNDIKIKFEVIWIMINLSSHFSEFPFHIAKDNNLKIILELLDSSDPFILQHTLMVLSNIVSESIFIRDKLLSQNLIQLLLSIIEKFEVPNLLEKILKLISNIYRYKYKNDMETAIKVLGHLEKIFGTLHINERVYTEGISIISNITQIEDFHSKLLSLIINSKELINKLFYYALSVDYEIELNCIVTIVNLTLCEVCEIQILIANGVLDILSSKLNFTKQAKIIIYSLRAISNISSGTISQLDHLSSSGIVQKSLVLFKLLEKKNVLDKMELSIVKEIYFIICNCITGGCTKMTYEIISNQHVEIEDVLSRGLEQFQEDLSLVKLISSSIYLLIKDDRKAESAVKRKFLACGIIEKIRSALLYDNNNKDISNFLDLLIDEFEGKETFLDEDEEMEQDEEEEEYESD